MTKKIIFFCFFVSLLIGCGQQGQQNEQQDVVQDWELTSHGGGQEDNIQLSGGDTMIRLSDGSMENYRMAPMSPLPATGTCEARLSWDENTELDLKGYRIYYRSLLESLSPLRMIDILAPAATHRFSGMVCGEYKAFMLTAYDTSDNESGYSNQVDITPTALSEPFSASTTLSNYVWGAANSSTTIPVLLEGTNYVLRVTGAPVGAYNGVNWPIDATSAGTTGALYFKTKSIAGTRFWIRLHSAGLPDWQEFSFNPTGNWDEVVVKFAITSVTMEVSFFSYATSFDLDNITVGLDGKINFDTSDTSGWNPDVLLVGSQTAVTTSGGNIHLAVASPLSAVKRAVRILPDGVSFALKAKIKSSILDLTCLRVNQSGQTDWQQQNSTPATLGLENYRLGAVSKSGFMDLNIFSRSTSLDIDEFSVDFSSKIYQQSFSKGTKDWDPDVFYVGADSVLSETNTESHSGGWSLSVDSSTYTAGKVVLHGLTIGQTKTFSFWVKSVSGGFYVRANGHGTTNWQEAFCFSANGDWQNCSLSVNITNSDMDFNVMKPGNVKFYLDDVAIE